MESTILSASELVIYRGLVDLLEIEKDGKIGLLCDCGHVNTSSIIMPTKRELTGSHADKHGVSWGLYGTVNISSESVNSLFTVVYKGIPKVDMVDFIKYVLLEV